MGQFLQLLYNNKLYFQSDKTHFCLELNISEFFPSSIQYYTTKIGRPDLSDKVESVSNNLHRLVYRSFYYWFL